MQLFYWKSPAGNFGDDLNQWLWDDVLPEWQEWETDRVLVGVGTIFDQRLLHIGKKFLVLGSGAGFGHVPDIGDREAWDIGFVRGPLTANALSLPRSMAITDPAAIVVRLGRFARIERNDQTLVVPHCHSDRDPNYDWPRVCGDAGLSYLSPRGDPEQIIHRIAGANRVITESMHAAIVADAFRVPWQVFSLVPIFNQAKWVDWAASLEVRFDITPLPVPRSKPRPRLLRWIERVAGKRRSPSSFRQTPPVSERERMALHEKVVSELRRIAGREPSLSEDGVLNARLDMMTERFQTVVKRYKSKSQFRARLTDSRAKRATDSPSSRCMSERAHVRESVER